MVTINGHIKRLITPIAYGAVLLFLIGCGGGGGGGGNGSGSSNNQPPTADAGPDQTVKVRHEIKISGSGSDPDGTIVSYQWKEGSRVLASTATFTYSYNKDGNHTLTLTVTDDDGASGSDSMIVEVLPNQPPTANAGPDRTTKVGHAVTISGSGNDPDGTIVSYRWKEGSNLLASTATFTYTPSSGGNHTLTLTVTDDDNATASDTMTVTATGNLPPVADAGEDKTVLADHNVTISGSCHDDDGTINSCIWSEGNVTLYSGTSQTAEFNYRSSEVGDHILTLTATDNEGASASDTMIVRVTPRGQAVEGDRDGDFIPDSIEELLGMDADNDDQNSNGILDGNESNGSASWADQFFHREWHLQSLGTVTNDSGVATVPGNDLHVMEIYHNYMGYNNGNPIIVQVVDNGVDADHEDLADNMDPGRSYDGGEVGDPSPDRADDTHGTKVAGIMAARAFNGLGVRGIAPFAKIAGSNWLEHQTYSNLEKAWLTGSGANEILVSNNSWGSYYDPDTIEEEIMAEGVKTLRDGKGRLYVFAAGNDRGDYGDGNGNANLQYMLSNRYAITVAGLKNDNTYADYSNPGANILVSGYSGNFHQDSPTIGTTTVMGTAADDRTWNDDTGKNYTYAMNGTSAAAPTVAGVLALVLEACPDLAWRDVRQLIAETAIQVDSSNDSWVTNDAGLHFSIDYGFGLINGQGMIQRCTAAGYTSLPAEQNTTASLQPDTLIPDLDTRSFTLNVPENLVVEWVEVTVDNNSSYASDYRVELKSPAGTSVTLMTSKNHASGYTRNWMDGGFRMSTAAMMNESSLGDWRVTLSDEWSGDEGVVKAIQIRIYGH